MGNRKLLSLLFYFSLIFLFPSAFAGAWNKPSEQYLIINSNLYYSSHDFQQVTTGTYVEYGVSDNITLGAKLDYALQLYDAPNLSQADGFTAAQVFAQKQLYRNDREVFSAKITYHAPTKLNRLHLQSTQNNKQIKYGNTVEIGYGYGRALDEKGNLFASQEVGYRLNLGDLSDQLQAEFLIGHKSKKQMLLTKIRSTHSLNRSFDKKTDFDLYTIELSLVRFGKKGRSRELATFYNIGGRNIDSGVGISLNFWRSN